MGHSRSARSGRFIEEFGKDLLKKLGYADSKPVKKPSLDYWEATGCVHLFIEIDVYFTEDSIFKNILSQSDSLSMTFADPEPVYNPDLEHVEVEVKDIASVLGLSSEEVHERFKKANLL